MTTDINPDEYALFSARGLTIRDYFAAKAMQAFLKLDDPEKGPMSWAEVAYSSYELADLMLAEREKKEGDR